MEPYSTPGSKTAYERAKNSLAGGAGKSATSVAAGYGPYPIYIARGEGARIYDVDGNEYIDYMGGFGGLILGHRPPRVLEAVKRVIDERGPMINLASTLEYEVAEEIVERIPYIELVRFASTGGEAVREALRAAREYTGRPKIIRFEGHFHGMSGEIHFSHQPPLDAAGPTERPRAVRSAGGIPEVLGDTLIVQPWNEPDILEQTVAEHKDEIAAIITEPVMGNCGVIPPRAGYLEFLRDITQQNGIVLIFDEVKTGFRLAFGGAQEYFGVTPDLSVFAKAIGGGFPAAAMIGGNEDVMEVFAAGRVWQSGTSTANLVSLAAMQAVFSELAQPGFYECLNETSERLTYGLETILSTAGVPATVQAVGSMFQVFFTPTPVTNYREAVSLSRPEQFDLFFQIMRERGVYLHPVQCGGCPFVSGAHTERDIDETLDRIEAAMPAFKAALREADLLSLV